MPYRQAVPRARGAVVVPMRAKWRRERVATTKEEEGAPCRDQTDGVHATSNEEFCAGSNRPLLPADEDGVRPQASWKCDRTNDEKPSWRRRGPVWLILKPRLFVLPVLRCRRRLGHTVAKGVSRVRVFVFLKPSLPMELVTVGETDPTNTLRTPSGTS
jgi:hypothetical protein